MNYNFKTTINDVNYHIVYSYSINEPDTEFSVHLKETEKTDVLDNFNFLATRSFFATAMTLIENGKGTALNIDVASRVLEHHLANRS